MRLAEIEPFTHAAKMLESLSNSPVRPGGLHTEVVAYECKGQRQAANRRHQVAGGTWFLRDYLRRELTQQGHAILNAQFLNSCRPFSGDLCCYSREPRAYKVCAVWAANLEGQCVIYCP